MTLYCFNLISASVSREVKQDFCNTEIQQLREDTETTVAYNLATHTDMVVDQTEIFRSITLHVESVLQIQRTNNRLICQG